MYLFFNISYINDVVVVFPSLPVTAIVLHGANSSTNSISDVRYAPLFTSASISGKSALHDGDLKIISKSFKFDK